MLEVKTARKKNYKCTSRDNKKEREKVKRDIRLTQKKGGRTA